MGALELQSPDNHTRVALVGLGNMGTMYARDILPYLFRVRLAAIASLDAPAGIAQNQEFGTPWFRYFPEMLETTRPQITIVAVPPAEHAKVAIAAAKVGSHVLIEKPFVLNRADAQAISSAQISTGVTIGCVYQQRYAPLMIRMKDAIQKGEFGKDLHIDVNIPWFRPIEGYYKINGVDTWRNIKGQDGGALWNQGAHLVDLVQWFLGKDGENPVNKACGTNRKIREGEGLQVPDWVKVDLRLQDRSTAHIFATTASSTPGPVTMRIRGSEGSAVIHDDKLISWAGHDGDVAHFPGKAAGGGSAEAMSIDSDPHRKCVLDFLLAPKEGRAVPITIADAWRSISIMIAVDESSGKGGEAVAPLPLFDLEGYGTPAALIKPKCVK